MALDLKNGRIDWIGQDYLGTLYSAKQDPTLVVLPDVRSPKTQGVAVSAKAPQLAKAMDALIVKYRGDGTLDGLIKKWFGQTVDWSKMPAD
jgi:ABC-type amino acid transport substrate-binding protein